jgi:hypothetical protein
MMGLDALAVGLQALDGLVAGFGAGNQGGVLLALHLRGLGCFGKVGGSTGFDAHLGWDVVLLR